MSRVTQELLANARAREAAAEKEGVDLAPPEFVTKSQHISNVVKKPAAKKRTNAKAKAKAKAKKRA